MTYNFFFFFCCGAETQRGSWPPHSWGFLYHTQRRTTDSRTPLDEWPDRRRDLFFFFQALNFLVESFGLLNDLFPLPSILDADYPVFGLHLADVLFDVILPFVLGSSLWSFVRGFQLNIFLTVLVSGILCTWPNQLSLWALMWLLILLCFISLSNSTMVLTLHIWFSFVGPNILLKIFLSKTNNSWIMASFNTHVSEA